MKDFNLVIEKVFNSGNKEIDRKNIKLLCKCIIKENKLEKIVRGINFNTNNDEDCLAAYYPLLREISINIKNLRESLPKSIYANYYNELVLRTLLHEFEHAKQYKLLEEDKPGNELLKSIIYEEKKYILSEDDNLLSKVDFFTYYMYSLIERNAEIVSNYKTLLIDKELEILKSYRNYLISKEVCDNCLFGYREKENRLVTPIEQFYKKMKLVKEYEYINFDEEYDTLTKLSWGMPVDKEILKDIKLLTKTNEYNHIMEIIK